MDYIKQILGSSIFQQYLEEGGASLSHENNEQIVQASINVLTGIETSTIEDGHVSPAEKRKRQLVRKQSLKALRNAVVPKISPVGTQVEKGSAMRVGGGGGASQKYEGHVTSSNLRDGTTPNKQVVVAEVHVTRDPGSHVVDQSSSIEAPPSPSSNARPTVNGIDLQQHSMNPMVVYPSNDPSPISKNTAFERSPNLVEARLINLSNSSTALAENSFQQSGDPLERQRQDAAAASGFSKGRGMSHLGRPSLSGSQPNISILRITQEGSLEFDDPMQDDIVDSVPDAGMEMGINPLEWNGQPHHRVSVTTLPSSGGGKKLTLSPISPPTSCLPPPSYFTHMTHNHTPNPPSHLPEADDPMAAAVTRRTPPPYILNTRARRTKSYEELLNADADFTHPSSTAFPLAPLVKPMTDGVMTRDLLTAEKRRTSLVIRLSKGKEGLGFRLKGLKKEQKGGLYVQDLQVGGAAERLVQRGEGRED